MNNKLCSWKCLPYCMCLLFLLPMVTAETPVTPNLAEYNRTCAKVDNLPINKICRGISNETLRLFGEDFGVHYVASKTKSRVFVSLILSKCQPGDYCVHLAQSEPSELEDRLLLSWRDSRVRGALCRLRPCLTALPECDNPERQLTFQAVNLLCSLTEMQQRSSRLSDPVPYCLEGVLDLLQYAYSDLHRPGGKNGSSSSSSVCNCVGHGHPNATISCPVRCRQMIYKFNCLYTQCLPHERKQIVGFPAWRWYFANSDALKSKYNVTFCERPIETAAAADSGNRGPVILAFFPNMGNVVMAVVLVVVVAALLMVGATCVCWQRLFLSKYARDRVQYTEVRGSL